MTKEIIEINLTMLDRDSNEKYSTDFPEKITKLISVVKDYGIQINFIHNFLEQKTRDYVQNNMKAQIEIYKLSVLNINQEISLKEYYQVLKEFLENVIDRTEREIVLC